MDEALARKAKGAAIFEWLAGMKVYTADLLMSDVIRGVDADGRPYVFDRYQDPDATTWTDDDGNAFDPLPDLDHRGTLALLEELMETPGDHVYTHPYDGAWATIRAVPLEEKQRRAGKRELGVFERFEDVLGQGATRAEAIVNALVANRSAALRQHDWLGWWLREGQVGLSSETIARVLSGERVASYSAPSDASDVGRCIDLLDLAAENGCDWRSRLSELAAVASVWAPLVPRWADIEAAYQEDKARAAATQAAAEKRWPKTWRRHIKLSPSRCYHLVSVLRGRSDPYDGVDVPWEREPCWEPLIGNDIALSTVNLLMNKRIITLAHLLEKSEADLLRLGLGRPALKQIVDALERHGKRLR